MHEYKYGELKSSKGGKAKSRKQAIAIGGRLQQVDDFYIEMKISSPEFYAYLLNKQCKPISNKGGSCEIRLFFPDSTDLEVTLKPFKEDGFRMESSVSGYQSYRVMFKAFGKTISAKFENENAIAHEK